MRAGRCRGRARRPGITGRSRATASSSSCGEEVSALARGGIRYAHVSADAIAYLRESRDETLLCLAARADHAPVRLSHAALGGAQLETLIGEDTLIDGDEVVLPAGGPAFHVWRIA